MYVDGNVVIRYNDELDYCREICKLLNQGSINGNTSINNNKTGCNTYNEINSSCVLDLIVNSKASEGVNTLREILTYAVSGDTITFDNNLFGETIFLDLKLTIAEDITIIGLGTSGTIIDGKNSNAFCVLNSSDSRFESMKITNTSPTLAPIDLEGKLRIKNIVLTQE